MYRIVVSGTGGQGVVLAGTVLARAGLIAGLHAAQSGSYSAQVRGALTRADVVLSEEPIDYPYVTEADVLVCLSSLGLGGVKALKPGGLLLVDGNLVQAGQTEARNIIDVPATGIASQMGNPQAANMVLLGVLVQQTGIFADEILIEAIRLTMKAKHVETNLGCARAGLTWNIQR